MELRELRAAARVVIADLAERMERLEQRALPSPAVGSEEERVLLAYFFRWLWEHADDLPDGRRKLNTPGIFALIEASPSEWSEDEAKDRTVRLRQVLANRLADHGLLVRTKPRAWRWVLEAPTSAAVTAVEPAALPAASENGHAAPSALRLGQTLTVVGLRLDDHGEVRVALRTGDGDEVDLAQTAAAIDAQP